MTKSTRSKWKKANRRQLAKEESGNVQTRIEKLNKKLDLCAKKAMGTVPPQDPETRFHFLHPEKRKSGERLVLTGIKTNPRGKSDPTAPHPLTVNFETVHPAAPIGGHAISVEDEKRMQTFSAEEFKRAAAEALENPDWTNDEPIEFTIGCNDDEHLTSSFLKGSSAKKSEASTSKKQLADGPKATKLKSMDTAKGTKGGRKMKFADAPAKRMVSK